MKLQADILIPILSIFLQTMLLLFIALFILKKMAILKLPYAGMGYGDSIVTAVFLFSVLYISTASIAAIIQAYKGYSAAGVPVVGGMFTKFSQFFMIVFVAEILFVQLTVIAIRSLGIRLKKKFTEDNIPLALLASAIMIPIAIMIKQIASEVSEYFIPQFIEFR